MYIQCLEQERHHHTPQHQSNNSAFNIARLKRVYIHQVHASAAANDLPPRRILIHGTARQQRHNTNEA